MRQNLDQKNIYLDIMPTVNLVYNCPWLLVGHLTLVIKWRIYKTWNSNCFKRYESKQFSWYGCECLITIKLLFLRLKQAGVRKPVNTCVHCQTGRDPSQYTSVNRVGTVLWQCVPWRIYRSDSQHLNISNMRNGISIKICMWSSYKRGMYTWPIYQTGH